MSAPEQRPFPALLIPESAKASETRVTVLARKPAKAHGPMRVLVEYPNGHIRYAETARLRTIPPGARRLTTADLRTIPWDETKHGPDPLNQVGQLFDTATSA